MVIKMQCPICDSDILIECQKPKLEKIGENTFLQPVVKLCGLTSEEKMRHFTIKEWVIILRGPSGNIQCFRGSGKTRIGAISSVFKANRLKKSEWCIVSAGPHFGRVRRPVKFQCPVCGKQFQIIG